MCCCLLFTAAVIGRRRRTAAERPAVSTSRGCRPTAPTIYWYENSLSVCGSCVNTRAVSIVVVVRSKAINHLHLAVVLSTVELSVYSHFYEFACRLLSSTPTMAANTQTNPTNLGHESACRLLSSTLTMAANTQTNPTNVGRESACRLLSSTPTMAASTQSKPTILGYESACMSLRQRFSLTTY